MRRREAVCWLARVAVLTLCASMAVSQEYNIIEGTDIVFISAARGDNISIFCNITLTNPTYQWQWNDRENDLFYPGSGSGMIGPLVDFMDLSNETSQILLFFPVEFGEQGEYRCVVMDGGTTVNSETAWLSVSPEGGITVSPLNGLFDMRSSVQLNCSSLGGTENYFQWLRNESVLSNDSMLTLTNIKGENDGGEYNCTVCNRAGCASAVTLVLVAPKITLNPVEVLVTNASDFETLMCEADAYPPPDYQWEHLSGGSDSLGESVMEVDGLLVFSSVSYEDYGNYSCDATSNNITVTSTEALLIVSPAGSVTIEPSEVTSKVGEVVRFNCSVRGGPDNLYTWTRQLDGAKVAADSLLEVTVTSGSDGGVYQCTVENAAGFDSSDVSLYVVPIILSQPSSMNVTLAEGSIMLACNASGFPIPTISWSHDGTEVTDSSRLNIDTDDGDRSSLSTLMINAADVAMNDSGTYQCHAAGANGSLVDSDDVTILVQAVPEQPEDLTAVPLSSTTIQLMWTEPHDNNAPIIGYIIRYQQQQFGGGQEVNETFPPETEVVIKELLPAVTYVFTVEAVNDIGGGNPSREASATTLTGPPNVTAIPETNINSTSASLTWDPPKDLNGEITGYSVQLVVNATDVSSSLGRRKRRQTGSDIRVECVIDGVDRTIAVPGNATSVTVSLTPDSTYSFRVQANTSVDVGDFSDFMSFTSLQGEPTAPRNVTVTVLSSTSVAVEWAAPLCRYGILTSYTVEHTPLEGPYPPLGSQGLPVTLLSNASSLTITGLTPYTNYSVSVYAATVGGNGTNSSRVEQTEEEAPDAVEGLTLTSTRSVTEVLVSLEWTPPSPRNGPYMLQLNYTAEQTPPYPASRADSDSGRIILPQDTSQFTIEGALPFAEYVVIVSAFNVKLGLLGVSDNATGRSEVIAPSAVLNLTVITVSNTFFTIEWEVPENPNGPRPIRYEVSYKEDNETDITTCGGQHPPTEEPTSENGYTVTNTFFIPAFIENLSPYTCYKIQVRAVVIFNGISLPGASDIELQRRTFSVAPPSVGPPNILATSTSTVTIDLPDPADITTGQIILYAVVVVRGQVSPGQTSYSAATSSISGAEYYITAAWDEDTLDQVPSTYVVGDGSRTIANGTTYNNVGLRSNTRYTIFIRIIIRSDVPNETIISDSNFQVILTGGPTDVTGGVVGGVLSSLLLIAILIIVVILIYFWRRRYTTARYKVTDEVATSAPETIQISVIANPETTYTRYSGTIAPMLIEDFGEHVKRMHSDDDYLFSEEYSSIEPEQTPTSLATQREQNSVKNRYANISAYDHSRVELQAIPGIPDSDYINANYIDGYHKKSAFIATQGPVPDSIPDFWRMVWEQGTSTIVMLTNLEERGRIKCSQYWPEGGSEVYGDLSVHPQDTNVLAEYTIRTFSLALQSEDSREERIVVQYHFTVWPDHGVPEHPTPLLHFTRKVALAHPDDSGPMIVHCSAGVGRTGTFITILSQLKQIRAENTIDIFGFVRSMRQRRCFMVQTEKQYTFIHDALLEAIECGVTEVVARNCQERYDMLKMVDSASQTSGMEEEFEKLQSTIHHRMATRAGTFPINKSKNRYTNLKMVPYDATRCRLSIIPGQDGSDYINASVINGYHKQRAFIATQGPLPDTTDDFWRMVWENNSATIVTLTKEREGGKVRCHKYWPESRGVLMSGQYQVIHHRQHEYSDYILREFKLVDTQSTDGSSLSVKQYHYLDWPEGGGVPESGTGMIDVIGQVQKWQRSSGNRPVIVHCSGGCGRTGVFIAINILIERLKTEGVVDVFNTVRTLRLQRPGMVQSPEQYEFCYRTVLEYLESFELYANFK